MTSQSRRPWQHQLTVAQQTIDLGLHVGGSSSDRTLSSCGLCSRGSRDGIKVNGKPGDSWLVCQNVAHQPAHSVHLFLICMSCFDNDRLQQKVSILVNQRRVWWTFHLSQFLIPVISADIVSNPHELLHKSLLHVFDTLRKGQKEQNACLETKRVQFSPAGCTSKSTT